jgi:diguanylate cyclase (GGDEF)-like protein
MPEGSDLTVEEATEPAPPRRRAGDAFDLTGADPGRAGSAGPNAQPVDAAMTELRHKYFDVITGVFGQELGAAALEREIVRAHRGGGQLVLAFIDVRDVSGIDGCANLIADDAVLRDVADALRRSFRSSDPIVRLASGEFICAVSSCSVDAARERFHEIRAGIAAARAGVTVSVGFAVLEPTDTLERLTARGTADLQLANTIAAG